MTHNMNTFMTLVHPVAGVVSAGLFLVGRVNFKTEFVQ